MGLEVGNSRDAAHQDGVPAQFESHFTDFSDAADYRRQIPVVPATILVDSRGVVQRVWFGILDDQDREDLRQLLGVGRTRPSLLPSAALEELKKKAECPLVAGDSAAAG